jgi:hypothetical protein
MRLASDSSDAVDLCGMFAAVLQAMRDGGYEDGFRDAKYQFTSQQEHQ